MQIAQNKNLQQLPDYWFLWNTEEKEQWVKRQSIIAYICFGFGINICNSYCNFY